MGRVVDGVVKAAINRTDGSRLQVDYGKGETALVYLWQVQQTPDRLTLDHMKKKQESCYMDYNDETLTH